MTAWQPPERVEPPLVPAGERESLESWLEYHRATLLVKCAGLDPQQLATRSSPPSSLSLLGLVRHMADVERNWFRRVLDQQDSPPLFYSEQSPDGDFDDVDPARADDDLAVYLSEVEAAREIAGRHDLGDVALRRRTGEGMNMRWILTHMIEEYARHNGHADLLREQIDGATGE